MTLATRTGLRPCGKRYATEDEALRSKRGLTGDYLAGGCPYGCGGWHLTAKRDIEKAYEKTRKAAARSDTGPDAATREAVYTRDGRMCVCCGTPIDGRPHSVGHRKRRSQGGKHVMPNLLTFLGLGSNPLDPDDHHARIDSRVDPHDEAKGYTVRRKDDPALIGVMYASEHGSGIVMWLHDDGSLSPDGPEAGEAA